MAKKKSKKKEELEDAVSNIVVDFVTYFIDYIKDKLFPSFGLHKSPKKFIMKHVISISIFIVAIAMFALSAVEIIANNSLIPKEYSYLIMGVILLIITHLIRKK